MFPNRPKRALTLIELMIVIGILMILAAVGVANFSEALIRAKHARVVSEFRSVATAIESYRVDSNQTPRMAHYDFYRREDFDMVQGIPVNAILSKCLTTPVSYLTSVNRVDPFMSGAKSAPLDQQFYTYQVISVYCQRYPTSAFWPAARDFYGDWRLASVGPDQAFDHNFANSAQLPYDPTNGLTSLGNIWYSSNSPPGSMPPIPSLLGEH